MVLPIRLMQWTVGSSITVGAGKSLQRAALGNVAVGINAGKSSEEQRTLGAVNIKSTLLWQKYFL